jgi:ribonuclease G
VVEISPLGLVEMTRQNVTEGPREILTVRCPTCDGDGIVVSEESAAVEAERRLRNLAAQKPRTKAFRVELNASVASLLIGPGASRLAEIEDVTRRRFFVDEKENARLDHFTVVAEGPLEKVVPETPVKEGEELDVKLVEVGLHDPSAGIAKRDGYAIAVGEAAGLVGKKVRVRVARALDGVAYATLVARGRPEAPAPITAEGLAEKPMRRSRSRKKAPVEKTSEKPVEEAQEEIPQPQAEAEPEGEAPAKRKRTRRGSRGGRRRRKAQPAAAAEANGPVETEAAEEAVTTATIHTPPAELGRETENGEKPRKRTRRGSRGGRGRRKKPAGAAQGAETPPSEGK